MNTCPYKTGEAVTLAPRLRMILAPNPSPMTHWGTNTYLLGNSQVAVIDPGPDHDDHLGAILAATSGRISHIFVTHSHLDHSPLARPLAEKTGAKIYAFGDHLAGRSAVMETLAQGGLTGGGEGIDRAFSPDIPLADGDIVSSDEWSLEALHTPGHLGNHLSFIWNDAVFTGDHVMGWASSLVSPPDGDLTDFMESCKRLANVPANTYYAGHGEPIQDPQARLAWLMSHRKNREDQIIGQLRQGKATPDEITAACYQDVPIALLRAAKRNVFAHLIDLHQRGHVTADPALIDTAIFALQNDF